MTHTIERKIIITYRTFKRIMKRYGKVVSFPKNTDPSKTYYWRYLRNFIDRCEKLDLDDDILSNVIEAMIIEAKRRKILHCGMSILTKIEPMGACQRKLERDIQDQTQALGNLERTYFFLQRQLTESKYNDLFDLLINKSNKKARPNIICWYDSNQISLGYLAVSRVCKKVLHALDGEQLDIFPNSKEMLRIRLQLLDRQPGVEKLRKLLGGDLFEEWISI